MTAKKPGATPGRNTIMIESTFTKLEVAFKLGMPKIKACEFAGINRQTLLNYTNDNPEYLAQIDGWRSEIYYTALNSLKESFTPKAVYNKDGSIKQVVPANYDNIRFYLSRKHKEEFSERQELTGKGGDSLPLVTNIVIQRVKDTKEE